MTRRIVLALLLATMVAWTGGGCNVPLVGANPQVQLSLEGSPIGEDDGVATVTATLDAPSLSPVEVRLAFSGTAGSGKDYTRSAMKIVVAPFQTRGSITLRGVADTKFEDTEETVIVDVESVIGGTEDGEQQVTAILVDNDGEPTVGLSLPAGVESMSEDEGTIEVTAALSNPTKNEVVVELAYSGTATVEDDYTRDATNIAIPAGQTTGKVKLTAVQDTLVDGSETIIIDIASVSGATKTTDPARQQVTVKVMDDTETPPTVTLGLTGSPFAEYGGVATVTATLSQAIDADATIKLAFSGTAGRYDYTRSADEIVIPAGQTSGSITLTGIGRQIYEGNETVIVDIAQAVNATEQGTQQVTAVITDSRPAPTVTMTFSAGALIDEAGGPETLTFTLSQATAIPTVINLAFAGTAQRGTDYTTLSTSVTIAAGQTTATLALTVVNDAIGEQPETILVGIQSISGAVEAGGGQQVSTTITDDDVTPGVSLSVTGSPVAEAGGTATVTATLTRTTDQTVTVNLSLDGDAVRNGDYAISATVINIAAGNTTGSVTITAIDDADAEADETIAVAIESVTNGLEDGEQQVTATIADSIALQNKQDGEAFLADNAGQPGVVVTDSGLQYKVLVDGAGAQPTLDDTISVIYRGTLIDGTVFDDSEGEARTFQLSGLIQGWKEALPLMKVGSRWMLYVPSDLGYGDAFQGEIGRNSVLIFDIELTDIE